jgi:hypothetical protein
MDVTQVTVEYGRTVSDGAYGSERVGVTLTAAKEEHERTAEVVAELGEAARGLVADQLRQAATPGVRRAVWVGDPACGREAP